jgi:PIN domain nuclease of toxin-antitoxin system
MRVLVDSNALIWAVDQSARLGAGAILALQDQDNQLLISAATIWEISIKVGLKKLSLSLPYKQWINQAISDLEMSVLPITADYADAQIQLPMHHGDPFDRLLVAQARVENLAIVSSDAILGKYGINRIWE